MPSELDRLLAASRPTVPPGFASAAAQRAAVARAIQRRQHRGVAIAFGGAMLALLLVWLVRPMEDRGPRRSACVVESSARGVAAGAAVPDGPLTVGDAPLHLSCAPGARVTLDPGALGAVARTNLTLQRGTAHLAGPASVTTPRAQVVAIGDDALVDVNVQTEESTMTPKVALIVAATAGSIVTVTVVRGIAHVEQAAPAKPVAVHSGETLALPAAPERPPVAVAPPTAIARETPPPAPAGAPDPQCDPSRCDDPAEDRPEPNVSVEIEGAPSAGKPDARVVIVEFGDFQCSFCEQAMSTIHQLADLYPDDVRIVFKNFPLPGHAYAQLAAEAALAAGAQGKFWEMHDLLYANRERLDRDSILSYAKLLGLNLARFQQALDEHTFAKQVEGDFADGQAAGVRGVPTFLINGRVIVGALPLDALKAIVDEELARTN